MGDHFKGGSSRAGQKSLSNESGVGRDCVSPARSVRGTSELGWLKTACTATHLSGKVDFQHLENPFDKSGP